MVVPAVSRPCCLRVLECRQLFDLGSGDVRIEDQGCFGIDSLGTTHFHCNEVFLAIRSTAGLDRIIMKIFSEGRRGVLLELGCPWDKEGSAVAARGSHGMTLPRHGQTQHQAKQRWGAMRSWSAGSSQTGRKLRTAHRWTESVY